MQAWGVAVCIAVIAGSQVLAKEPLAFLEDVKSESTRIVSGWEAVEGQIPWQLSLRMVSNIGGVSACGGSIIHSEWGITAAHCTALRVTMVIRAGAVSLTQPELLFETTQYWNHPAYIDSLSLVQPHDISILKFPLALTFTDRVQPIRIQRDDEKNRNYAGIRLEASGWGRTWTNGDSPVNLQWVYLSGVSNQECWLAFGGSSIIVDSTICASGYNVTSQSTCQGDSGGPLVEQEVDGKYTMVGISSFVSSAGCHADFPAGFIRPGHYHDWYTEITGLSFTDWELEETTQKPTTEAPESESSESSSSESSSSESDEDSEESEETGTTTEAASSEEATTEAAATEEPTTEAPESGSSESSSSESSSSESNEDSEESEETGTTTEAASSEEATTEAARSEEATTEAAGSEEATTEAATTEADSDEDEEDSEGSRASFYFLGLF